MAKKSLWKVVVLELDTGECWEVEKTMPRKRAIWTAAAIAAENKRATAVAIPAKLKLADLHAA